MLDSTSIVASSMPFKVWDLVSLTNNENYGSKEFTNVILLEVSD